MAVEIRVPELGESVVEATVGQWQKHEGESVSAGDLLVELETDKVNLEITAEQDGVLQSIAKKEGDTVGIGEVLAVVGEGQGGQAAPSAAPAAEQPASVPATQAPSAAATTPQPEPGETLQPSYGASPATTTPPPAAAEANGAGVEGETALVGPSVRRMAEEHNLDLSQVPGSGPRGSVTKEDLMAYIETGPAAVAPPAETRPAATTPAGPPTSASAPAPAPPRPAPAQPQPSAPAPVPPGIGGLGGPPAAGRREERVRLSRRRQTIATRLVETQRNAAMLTTFNEVDMSAIMAVRARRKDVFRERHGVGLGFMSFFTRAVVGALKAFPLLNAEIQGNEIVYKYYYDIGIAVATDEGLVVPVLRDADRKSFAQVEREIADMADRARQNKLTLAELQGGTFSITNGGVFGSLLSTPILNGPQVGILGMHKIEQRPIALDSQVVIRPMMYLAVSYDHRLVDGREAVQFLVRIKELLEDPETLLLEG